MNAETRRPWSEMPASVPLYDHCFIFDQSYETELRAAGAQAVHFLPCAADPDLYKPFALTTRDRVSYEAAVSLIGVYAESRAAVVSSLARCRVWESGGRAGRGGWPTGGSEMRFVAKRSLQARLARCITPAR